MCPTDAELLAFVDGSLPPEARSGAETHLDSCPSCLAIVAALARTSRSGRSLGGEASAPSLATPAPHLPQADAMSTSKPSDTAGPALLG